MKVLGGLLLIAISGGVYLYTRSATNGQMVYVMWGPALFGAGLVLQAWLED